MLPVDCFELRGERVQLAAGTVLVRRGAAPDTLIHLDAGRVALGLVYEGQLEHQLGTVEGPSWLEASAVLLDLPMVVDAVAQTSVTVRHLPASTLRPTLDALPLPVQSVLHDVALAHRQQTELAVSRLAKDAEARCAEWLLRHAHADEHGALEVSLSQRKRMIAAQLGIAPETLSRVLRQLRERSLISGSGRILNLVNPVGLRSLAGV